MAASAQQEPKRYRLPPDAMHHENGFCYIAGMDFGEEGDKFTDNGSQLMVFEDGERLGPPHSLHRDIREQGQGRYSHWTREHLYFSASDNTDPRSNGRVYEVASTNPHSTLGGLEDLPCTERTHVEEITASEHEYEIEMGGTLDMENTLTVAGGNYRVAFQPNVQLTIENVGDTPIVNPRLVINERGNWYTFESLLEEFTRGAETDQDRVYLIWQNMRMNLYHESPLFGDQEPHDPVRLMNIFGLNLCDDAGNAGCSLYHHGGFPGSKNRALHGHVQCEALVDGEFQFMDIDMDCFYLDRENEIPVSGDAIARDHDLARRELNYGPEVGKFTPSDAPAALFGPDDGEAFPTLRGHEIAYTLRPGERAVFRWDDIGKWCAENAERSHRAKYFGNSKFVFEPRLTLERIQADAASHQEVAAADEGVAGTSPDGEVVYRIAVPYAICGGTVRAELAGGQEGDAFSVELSLDGEEFAELWSAEGNGPHRAEVALDEALDVHNEPAKYEYFVRLGLGSAGEATAVVRALAIETDVMAAPQSLPRLGLGTNRCVYSDETDAAHAVRITHEWRETDAVTPLEPPTAIHPADGQEVTDSIVEYSWEPVDDAARYHLQVSRRADFAWPYRTSLDVIIPQATWEVPFTGIYSPGVTYYWRLRTRDRWGVWGPWSEPRTFTWRGPRVPVNVRLEFEGRTGTLRWDSNPHGPRPVRYAVFGSDEKGFTANREPHVSYTRGEVPGNLVGETDRTSMVVIGPDAGGPNTNRVFYRVVAIDGNGTESGNSDYAEAPHPFIYSDPPTRARVGEEYRYEVKSLRSLGDVQHHYEEPGNQFWDIEENGFSMANGPAWLSMDESTGLLSGTPAEADVGTAAVSVIVANQFEGRAEQQFELTVAQ
ncbi:MAG: Ig domain-containing protein [Armatimonadota bacterium]|nr:Ig domain-containing protein [Armatimonadota bacterium]